MTHMTYRDETASGFVLKGWHVLLIMLGFFGVIFAVNGVFLFYAITSHPGEQVEKSYLQGLAYNQTLEARAAQAELGWQAAAGFADAAANTVTIRLEDRNGRALSGLDVTGQLLRTAAAADHDVPLDFVALTDGEYIASGLDLCGGQWRLVAIARSTNGEQFEINKTLTKTSETSHLDCQ